MLVVQRKILGIWEVYLNDKFCIAPFISMSLMPNGYYRPCCLFKPLPYKDEKFKKYSILETFNSDENKDLRKKFLNGEFVENCFACHKYESEGNWSLRNQLNTKFYDEEYIKNPRIKYLEFSLSNICNLKCIMCSSDYSNRFKGYREINNFDVFTNLDFDEIDEAVLSGGEPFAEKRLYSILDKMSKNTKLIINTNCTIFPDDQILSELKKFKNVNIKVSFDATSDTVVLIRRGIKYENFLKTLEEWKKNDFFISFQLVYQIMNCLDILNIEKVMNRYSDDILFTPLYNPKMLDVSYIPDEFKKIILEYSKNSKFLDLIDKHLKSNKYNHDVVSEFLLNYNNIKHKKFPKNLSNFLNELERFHERF